MGLSDEQLIDEAIECKPRRGRRKDPREHRGHLVHFAQYLASAHGSDFYRANKKQSPLHGTSGEEGRRRPRSRAGVLRLVPGARSARRTARAKMVGLLRKGHPSALRFLYHHLQADDELPDLDPTVLESSPRSSSGAATRRARRRSSACWRRPARAAPSAGAPALLYALPARDLRRRAVVRHRPRGRRVGGRRQERQGRRLPAGAAPDPRLPGLPTPAARRGRTSAGDPRRARRSREGLRADDDQRQEDQPLDGHQDRDLARHPRRGRPERRRRPESTRSTG